jgi:predicted secreted protein
MIMAIRDLRLVTIVLCGAMLTGCRCASQHCVPSTAKLACPAERTLATATTPDISAVEAVVERLPSPDEEYRLLDEHTCQCTAAGNAYLANMLRLEQHLATMFAECESARTSRNLTLQRNLLALYAADKRGLAASNAMLAFYYLNELETAIPYLDRVIEETSDAQQRAAKLTGQDLAPTLDPTDFERQLLELRDRRAELDLRRLELNGQLQRQLGCTLATDDFFWPQVSPVVEAEPVDVDAAVAVGLATRQDLRMIRLVICNLEREKLTVVQAFLGAVDGALGTATVQDGTLHRLRCIACSDNEVPVRCRQLKILLDDAERAATVAIRLAAFEVKAHYERIVIAQQKVDSWRARVDRLTAKRAVEDTTVFEISAAQNELYQAEIDVVHHVTQLRLARLALRQAQGLLPGECGYAPVICCPPCDDGGICIFQ